MTDKLSSPDIESRLLTQDILARSKSRPILLSSIEVLGGETFSNEFFKKLLRPLSESSDYTLEQLLDRVTLARSKLEKTNVFKKIHASIETDNFNAIPAGIKNYSKEKPLITKVVFDLDSVCLNVGEVFLNLNNDDILNVSLNYLNNNFNENAELVNFGVSYNPYKPNQHLVANAKFLASLNDPSLKFLIDIFNTHQNNQVWQQASEKSLGSLIGLQYSNRSKKFSAFSGMSILKRVIHDVEDASPDDVKFFSGDYLKTSIVNQAFYTDLKYLNSITRNFPISGYNLCFSHELSSSQEQEKANTSAVFNKATLSVQLYKSIFDKKITINSGLDLGVIHSTSQSPVHVSDRFFLGGTNSFRGFSRNSINVNGASQFFKLDGTILASLPSFVYSPSSATGSNVSSLENDIICQANPLRLYANGAIGSVSNNVLSFQDIVSSMGCGIRYINHWANFDIGYYFAKRYSSTSTYGIKDGLQFSVSIGGSNRTN